MKRKAQDTVNENKMAQSYNCKQYTTVKELHVECKLTCLAFNPQNYMMYIMLTTACGMQPLLHSSRVFCYLIYCTFTTSSIVSFQILDFLLNVYLLLKCILWLPI